MSAHPPSKVVLQHQGCSPTACAPIGATAGRSLGTVPGVEAIKVLVRRHQNLIWVRNRHTKLRNALREYYPALAERDALAVLGRAPTPAEGGSAHGSQVRAARERERPVTQARRPSRRDAGAVRNDQLEARSPVAMRNVALQVLIRASSLTGQH